MEALDTGRLFLPPKGLRRLFAALTGQGRDGAGDGAGEILPVRQAHPFAEGEANDVFRGTPGKLCGGLHPEGIVGRETEDTAGIDGRITHG